MPNPVLPKLAYSSKKKLNLKKENLGKRSECQHKNMEIRIVKYDDPFNNLTGKKLTVSLERNVEVDSASPMLKEDNFYLKQFSPLSNNNNRSSRVSRLKLRNDSTNKLERKRSSNVTAVKYRKGSKKLSEDRINSTDKNKKLKRCSSKQKELRVVMW